MNELDERLRTLVRDACSNPPGSLKRQRCLTQIIRLVSGKLWKESVPYYQDAVQQTWIYFCQNICEGKTGACYDPNRSGLATWLNSYLRRRLQDYFIEQRKQEISQAAPQTRQGRSGEAGEVIDPLDMVAAEPDVPPILDQVKQWVESDPNGELSRVHIEGHPQVNCQVLILRRLPPETGWKELSGEFGLSVSTLSSFYQRQCLPRLRKFGETEGYL